MLAAADGCNDVVNLLLTSGAEVNAKDDSDFTALHVACNAQHEETVRCLIQKGANISPESNEGHTPLSFIVSNMDKEGCIIIIIKEITKLVFKNIPCSKKDLDLIQKTPRTKEHFEKCTAELEQMSTNKFYGIYSYYFVLDISNSMKKLVHLTKNKEFVKAFEANLHNFHYYADDLQRIFKEAVEIKDKSEEVHARLYSVFGDVLPDIAIRKLGDDLALEDLPL